MARVEDGLGWKGEEDAGDAREQLPVGAAGEVGAADAPGEEGVATEDYRRGVALGDEDDVSPGVAGEFPHPEGDPGRLDEVAIGEEAVGARTLRPAGEEDGQVPDGGGEEVGVGPADGDGDLGEEPPEFAVGSDVVGVAMGVEDEFGLDAEVAKASPDEVGFSSRVDEQAAGRSVAAPAAGDARPGSADRAGGPAATM